MKFQSEMIAMFRVRAGLQTGGVLVEIFSFIAALRGRLPEQQHPDFGRKHHHRVSVRRRE